MDKINASSKTISSVLNNQKFTIDYYQREFQWETKQITELLNDLTHEFSLNYIEGHERTDVKKYKHYFLGSIMLSQSDTNSFSTIIDGQQRLTSITLLLIYIYHRLSNSSLQGQILPLIFSDKFGELNFNIDIGSDPKRTDCMNKLFKSEDQEIPNDEEQSKSVKNILTCYQEIKQILSSDKVIVENLPLFTDWLTEKVYLVEITAYSAVDAYTIFETMNDRGLSLTPADMLKGYLFSRIDASEEREKVNEIWQERITSLHQIGKDEEGNAIKSCLRSQYAKNIPDFDKVGSGFHRWVRDKEKDIGLFESGDFVEFIKRDLDFYTKWYRKIRLSADEFTDGLEAIYYNNQNNFTLQFPVLLSALVPSDNEDDIHQKLKLISQYLDILIHRYIWNWKTIAERSMRDPMFHLISKIRQKPIQELRDFLCKDLENDEIKFTSNRTFGLRHNQPQVRKLLARMTDYIEIKSGHATKSRYTEYIQSKDYQIEHIWANHFERYQGEFDHKADFEEYRNQVGGLLLLPKTFNASYGDMIYHKKYEHYLTQNWLAASLHERAYENNPEFSQFIKDSGLKFRSHPEFKRKDLELRQELYLNLAEVIWHPKVLKI